MSEVPDSRMTDFVPTDDRYITAFGLLPLQSTLNMLEAYRPDKGGSSLRTVRQSIDTVRKTLLESGQVSKGTSIDLSDVEDDVLEAASDYLWRNVSPQIIAKYRVIGGKVIPIARHQSA